MIEIKKSNERIERKQIGDSLTAIETDVGTNTSDISTIQSDIIALQAAVDAMSVPTGLSIPETTAANQPLGADIPGMAINTLTSTTDAVWQEVAGYTGAGILEFLVLRLTSNTGSADIDVRLTIDSTVIWTDNNQWTSSGNADEAIPFVGAFSYDTTDSRLYALSLDRLEFETDWKVEKRQAQVSSTTVKSYHKHQEL